MRQTLFIAGISTASAADYSLAASSSGLERDGSNDALKLTYQMDYSVGASQ